MPAVDISIFGDKALEKKLARLPGAIQKRVVRKAARDSLKRFRPLIASATPVETGRLRAAMTAAKIQSQRSRSQIRITMKMPTRDELGIPADAKGYYPFHVEYGYVTKGGGFKAGRSYIRKIVDANKDAEHGKMRTDIRAGIVREAKKK